MAAESLDESTNLILCTTTQFVLPCNQWFHDELKFFFHYLLLLEWTFRWALSSFQFSFLFAFHLECSLSTNVDKKSNAVCIFANLCSTLLCSSIFVKILRMTHMAGGGGSHLVCVIMTHCAQKSICDLPLNKKTLVVKSVSSESIKRKCDLTWNSLSFHTRHTHFK